MSEAYTLLSSIAAPLGGAVLLVVITSPFWLGLGTLVFGPFWLLRKAPCQDEFSKAEDLSQPEPEVE